MHFADSSNDGEPKNPSEIDGVLATTDSPECVNCDDIDQNEQELYKLRAEYYRGKNDHVIHMATEVIAYETETIQNINGHGLGRESPLILIDIGASRSVRGRKWAEWWFGTSKLTLDMSKKQFRFGAGPTLKSMGTTVILIHVQSSTTNKDCPIVLPIKVDVVDSNVPMLISHESLKHMKGSLDFGSRKLIIPDVAEIKLTNTCSGHLMIQGTPPPLRCGKC